MDFFKCGFEPYLCARNMDNEVGMMQLFAARSGGISMRSRDRLAGQKKKKQLVSCCNIVTGSLTSGCRYRPTDVQNSV
jgi:hypothetical protein